MSNRSQNSLFEEFSDSVVIAEAIFITGAFVFILLFLGLIKAYGEDAKLRGYFVVQEFGISSQLETKELHPISMKSEISNDDSGEIS